MRLGIIGCAEIAHRRFMPAVQDVSGIEPVAVSEEYAPDKLKEFTADYPMDAMDSHAALIAREDIDCVYIPQPPALHFKWARAALQAGKHVLIEKPSTTCYADSKALVDLAREKGLALHENYMFQYHAQIEAVQNLLSEGVIGDLRLFRADFGFPLRAQNDFRYNPALGGGALLDAGGYPVRLAAKLLGDTARVTAAHMQYLPGFEVDMAGSVTVENEEGLVFQIGYGMDCGYRCALECWGSKGRLMTGRIFTAPPGFTPTVQIETANGTETRELPEDAHFQYSIEEFLRETENAEARNKMYDQILLQASMIEDIRSRSKA